MIVLKNVNFNYGKKQILKELSFSVKPSECIVIAGANGSGKTTILKLIAGIIKKESGDINVDGNIGYIPQGVALFDDMTVGDNINFFSHIGESSRMVTRTGELCEPPTRMGELCEPPTRTSELCEPQTRTGELREPTTRMGELCEPLQLGKYRNTKICNLSGGIAKITSIVCSLSNNPDNILYDEPCANLDIVYVEQIRNIIKMQKESNKSIIYVGHLYDEFDDFYDKLLFINGKEYVLYNKNELSKEKYLSLFK